ncbi:GntR family transcriptional regulator [Pseudarthrobacter sulfonivorans]|uniref:GntR family transcriptional regulator n=1 Tax=Pseudarthrobacter sulfonivorans TaxID=121292 RepID=UPI00295ECDAF|nr:GntR family transcriptional regulator [Pseudarthrobacter sulfonivorans]
MSGCLFKAVVPRCGTLEDPLWPLPDQVHSRPEPQEWLLDRSEQSPDRRHVGPFSLDVRTAAKSRRSTNRNRRQPEGYALPDHRGPLRLDRNRTGRAPSHPLRGPLPAAVPSVMDEYCERSNSARSRSCAVTTTFTRGEVEAGRHLVETELSERVKIGRGTLRKALRQFVQEGLLDLPSRAALRPAL